MKIKCQECNTIIEIEDSEYPKGIEQTIECPLCQHAISFTLDDEINHDVITPPIPPSNKGPKKGNSRSGEKDETQSNESSNKDQGKEEANQQMSEDFGSFYRFIFFLGYHSSSLKKGIIIIGILLAIFFIGKHFWHSQSQPANFAESNSIEEIADTIAIEGIANESDSIISFLTSMYESSMYASHTFLNRHCTQHLLTVLSESYDYECDTPPCYATWLFRTSAQEEKSSTENENRLISVRDIGDNWFEVEFYDNGWKGIKRIKAYYNDDIILMDIIETVYDEAAENLKNMEEKTDSTETSTTGYITKLSERKLTENDLIDLSTTQLEILRNMIFAKYGYKFNREDLSTYFSKYSWYRPTMTDVTTVYENMSEIEKYNVDFIKSHE